MQPLWPVIGASGTERNVWAANVLRLGAHWQHTAPAADSQAVSARRQQRFLPHPLGELALVGGRFAATGKRAAEVAQVVGDVARSQQQRVFGDPQHPGELAERECLLDLPRRQEGWRFLVDGVMADFPVRGRLRANNGDALLEAAIRRLGTSVQPGIIAAAAIDAGSVAAILHDFPMPEPDICALLPGDRHVAQRVRMLVDDLAERIGQRPYREARQR
ncbi:LysR substrate-binding domain-containing protein [Candidatus Accumulibacter sp. ACC003]|uniref:LysR substrate-binding domain-containing protein n=1 Tax=Candidatus Accumulibacter sp. ACC003 TaxID=2823334 RepID=UPI00344D243B